ncbi:uncharacterized protein LOC134782955 isoform X2 [Penaeus indicus]|uniref:uncharacterized protein LOC134782955 isoform X2 n=1 Tax=Penaeus indicus TaxID=29960 RepID=UPI00300D7C28
MDYKVYPGRSRTMYGGEVQKTFKIFCGNLAGATTKEDLHYLFSQYGPVIEAVVVTSKDFGFVHMAYEEDGWKAICELRGYYLHGRAMAVEASINTKKAAPLHKQNIIGKGMSSLDDFNEFTVSKPRGQEHRDAHSESYPPFRKTESSTTHSAPPGLFSYPPPAPSSSSSSTSSASTSTTASSSSSVNQPSPLGSASSSRSQVSPMSDLSSGKTLNAIKEREPPTKVQPVDANSNPIHEANNEVAEKKSALCETCGSVFDEWQHKPKILSCGHTFCLDCLICLARDTEVKCPAGCSYTTALTEAGISGLTTNYTVPIKKYPGTNIPSPLPVMPPGYGHQNGAQSRAGSSPIPMVCCTCPKIPAMDMCSNQGHQLIPEDQARDILRGQLQSNLEVALKQLRHTMAMRAAMKERLERTVLSVEKFVEELRGKVEGEELEEAVLQEHLTNLTVISETLSENNSIAHLIDSLQIVHSYTSIITNQFSQCAAVTAINHATEAIVIKLKQSALDSLLSTIGFRNEEPFVMTSSLEEHAMYGNNANVLLLYMLSDLLSSRMLQLSSVSPMSPLSPNHPPPLTSSNSMQSPLATAVTSAPILQDSLGLTHSKVGEMKTHEMGGMNIEHILQMTEAIETGSLLNTTDGMTPMSVGASAVGSNAVPSALSLGLSNLSLLVSESTENGKDDVESLTDKKEVSSSYVDAAKKPAKPTPPPENSSKLTIANALPPITKPSKFPHCWMVLSINGVTAGRIIFELRPDKAPRMCDNFIALCTGKNGYGYKGTHFFRSGEGFLAGGDVENDDGSGGYSAFDKKTFEADLCPLKDEVGMVRFKGIGTTDAGRGMIGSQFMIWCGEREFKKFAYSLVFGKVVDGLDVAKKAAAINVHRVSVKVEDCGARV